MYNLSSQRCHSMVLFKYVFSLFEGIIREMMLCFKLVALKHISWRYYVMELKTPRPENCHCMLLSCECQVLLYVSSYSSISSSVKGTQCMYIVSFFISIPSFCREVLFKSIAISWHFYLPILRHTVQLRKSIFIVYFYM